MHRFIIRNGRVRQNRGLNDQQARAPENGILIINDKYLDLLLIPEQDYALNPNARYSSDMIRRHFEE